MFKRINESFKDKINKPLLISVFILFLFILIWIIIFKGVGLSELLVSKRGIIGQILVNIDKNIIERFTLQFQYVFHYRSFFKDIIPNIIIFIPFGLFLSLLNKNNLGVNIIITFCLSLFFEIFELITGIGGISYIDVLTNLLGFIIGFGIYKLINTIFKEKVYNQLINYLLLIFLVLFVPFVIYVYVQIIINFDIFLPCFNIDNYRNLFNFN